MRNFICFFGLFLLLSLSLSTAYSQCNSDTPHLDYAALMAFYESTNGAEWTNNDGWREGAAGEDCDPCSENGWEGITCRNGRVTSLIFVSNNLSGPLPKEIQGLSSLEVFTIESDSLTGVIPKEIGNLSELLTLNLSRNSLSGAIPAEIGNLTKIQSLNLQVNELVGSIPSSIGNLSFLSHLYLGVNMLEGQIPPAIWLLRKLATLSLSFNNFTGQLSQEISNLTELRFLFLTNNNLTGIIPNELCSLTNLSSLSLGYNDLTGEIPSCIGNLSQLRLLSLRDNNLSGNIPVELFNLTELVQLFLDRNLLDGIIPQEIGKLQSLTRMVISDNKLSGDISFICDLASLEVVAGDNNNFNGEIPQCILESSTIRYVSFGSNNLYGCFPESDITLCDLEDVNIESNDIRFSNNLGLPWGGDFEQYCASSSQIGAPCTTNEGESGIINEDCACSIQTSNSNCETEHPDYAALMAFYESTNGPEWTNNDGWRDGATGSSCVPCNSNGTSWFGITCHNDRVVEVRINNNNLTGFIPDAIGGLTQLVSLELRDNLILGDIPHSIDQLVNLIGLDLSENMIEGSLPVELFDLQELVSLNLNDNQLSGSIPDEIRQLGSLEFLFLSDNNLSDVIPSGITELTRLSLLFLSNNDLQAPLPELGRLVNLRYLVLDGNDFNTPIPDDLGELLNLELLSLSLCNFRDTIPNSLKSLTSLQDLFLHSNNLEGSIENFIPPNINTFFASGNSIEGDASYFCTLPNIQRVIVARNSLTGEIPMCFLESNQFEIIALSNNNLTGCFPESDSTFCDKTIISNITFTGNPGLPWNGNLENYCSEATQIGAPCTTSNGEDAEINEECTCSVPLPCQSTFDIGPTDPEFRGKRCLFQPVVDQEIRDSEAILIKNPVPKRKYVFSFCEGYSATNFEALVTIVEYDRETGSTGQTLFENLGCSHEFTVPENLDYEDILIIINDANDCSSASRGIENGIPVFKCGVGRG